MIRDVIELREHGRVCRRVATLPVDPDTWRAGMRRAARREGMRIRTYVISPPSAASTGNSGPADQADHDAGGPGADLPTDQQHPIAATAQSGALVYAVRTDRPPDHATMTATINQPAAAPVTSLSEQRARRSGHPCTGSDPD
jgi:hypothetical protein